MMHKTILLLIGIFVVTSCKNESKQEADTIKEYALLSGQAIDYNGLLKLKNEEGVYELKIGDDGIFGDTIRLNKPQEYAFQNAVGQTTFLYLYPGAQLHIEIKGDNLEEGVTFSGDGATETNYLIEKKNLLYRYDWYPDLEKEKETHQEVVAKFEMRHEKMLAHLETSEGLTDAFKENEKKRLHYTLLNSLAQYESLTQIEPEEGDHVLPEKYRSQLTDLPIDREADYRLSENYRALVFAKVMSKVGEKAMQDTLADFMTLEFEEVKKIKNEHIRNAVGYESAEGMVLYSDPSVQGLKKVHDYYMSFATDDNRKEKFVQVYEAKLANARGRLSPKFKDYENYKGGTASLDDFKGQYLYIDIWATWCSPCIAEIPFLEKIEKKYHDKNLTFVSISIDSKRDYEKWKKMIKDKNMAGVQLIADKDFDSEFIRSYNIFGIPRFLLIDPEGKIISANAPRPSELIDTSWMEEQGI